MDREQIEKWRAESDQYADMANDFEKRVWDPITRTEHLIEG